GGPTPVGRDIMGAVYDPNADRMVLLGGGSGTYMLGDTEFLTWDGEGSAASATATPTADPRVAHLTWNLSNSPGLSVGVYRSQGTQPWSSIATADADLTGAVSFDDATVQPGQSYNYLVVLSSEQGALESQETQVDVPTPTDVTDPRAAFGMRGIQPNPA